MSSLEENILSLGQSNKLESLQKLITDTEEDELVNLINKRIMSGSFIQTLNYILKGLSSFDSSHAKEKKLNIVIQTLKALDGSEFRSSQVNDIVNYISADLPKYSTDCLVQLSNYCLEGLQNNESNQYSWKEIFPEVLSILSERESVEYNGSEISGKEYKKHLLNALCMLQWVPARVTVIASMFIEMPLTKEEHLQVVNKLGSYLEKLTALEIPGFVFQLLKLCRDENLKNVLMRLQTYFGLRIYETSSVASFASSDSIDLDAIGSASHQDLLEAESTVLYHIHSLATLSSNSVKEYLIHLKNMMRAPEFILHPFQLTVLLTICTIQHYEEKVFEILKSCVSRYYNEQHKKEGSVWFHDMVPKFCDIQNIFLQVLTMSLQDRDTVLQGLVNFAFVLLNIKSGLPLIFIDPIAEKEWNLGMVILLKIIRNKRHNGGIIIQEIINNVLTDQNVTQYIECLYLLSRNLALILLENQSSVIELMEDLMQIPGSTAIQLLDAIMPLTRVSSTIRDHLILLLRKALYSSKTETRQMAVMGYIKLLTTLKISSITNLSQLGSSMSSFSSGHSLFTQLSLNRSSQCSQNSFSNEALCLEILSILKRCFMQKYEVKNQLYEGLFDAVCQNLEIRTPVLDILWIHFSNYYVIDEDTIPPLDFSKISITKDVDVIQQEPLGKLIHVIGLILTQGENGDSLPTVLKFKDVMESICDRMINCELVHLELDDGTDLSDMLPECQQKVYILQEAMRIYEALIAYKINSWNNDSTKNGAQIVSLFQGYHRLHHFSKNIGKSKKERKKKKNDSDVSDQTNNTTIPKNVQKLHNTFKLPETVLDFQTTIKALQLLHEPVVQWTSIQEANVVKSKTEIHQHCLKTANHLVISLKGKKRMDSEENKKNFKNLVAIAEVIYNRCIKTLSNFIDFDCTSAILAAECFHAIVNCISSSFKEKDNFLIFLCHIVKKENVILISCLTEVIEVYQKLFEMDEELDSEDPEIKKLSLIFINTLTLFSNFIPAESSSLSIEFYDWLKNYAENQTLQSRPTATPFFTLLFSMQIRFKKDVNLLVEMINRIGHILGIVSEDQVVAEENYQIINDHSVHNAYMCTTNAVKTLLDEVDWVISRLKSEYVIMTHVDDANNFRRKESLVSKEKGITCQLCFVVTILEKLTSVTTQPGNLAEALFKNISQFYTTLTNLTRYFNSRSTKVNPAFQGARFEKLVKFVGRGLSHKVNYLISNLEEESRKEQSTQTKKKSGSSSSIKTKILKDTRLIPKVVYGMEQFSTCIIQLSNKTKINLSKHVGQGITRDFRIMVRELPVHEENDDTVDIASDEENNDESKQTDEESTQVSDQTEEEESPPPKKSRKS